MGLWDCVINHRQNFSYQESKTSKFRPKSLCTLCTQSGGTDGMSRHQYQSQLNTIACHAQAALHSLIMSGWHCWSHMAAGVWEFNHRAAIKLSLHYSWPPLWLYPHSLACPDHLPPGLGEAGGGRRASTWFAAQQIAAPWETPAVLESVQSATLACIHPSNTTSP